MFAIMRAACISPGRGKYPLPTCLHNIYFPSTHSYNNSIPWHLLHLIKAFIVYQRRAGAPPCAGAAPLCEVHIGIFVYLLYVYFQQIAIPALS